MLVLGILLSDVGDIYASSSFRGRGCVVEKTFHCDPKFPKLNVQTYTTTPKQKLTKASMQYTGGHTEHVNRQSCQTSDLFQKRVRISKETRWHQKECSSAEATPGHQFTMRLYQSHKDDPLLSQRRGPGSRCADRKAGSSPIMSTCATKFGDYLEFRRVRSIR